MWAVVPSKQFGVAKRRLAALLSEAERVFLAEVMLNDVLSTLHACSQVNGIIVVSKEPAARRLAERYGATFVLEVQSDLSLAVTQGGAHAAALGAKELLIVPGDVPLVTVQEIEQLICLHGQGRGLTLVPDRSYTGTNGLIVSPINLISFSYGVDSFNLHAEAARAVGSRVQLLELDKLSLDIDTPEDVRALMTYEQTSMTLDYLDEINVVSRLPGRHNVSHVAAG
ncbi:MAG TPA: 2-phospho-L-lactate guanylyltransferase [Gammaproteobacteria bacterium]|nr:2-phospho-L-lactate guanylyltransferase [Gammaproteobacteria bacterium]|tara:strand:- start:1843 stop:2520 length:678 start_codon:yes stop_codon:yes gene_type:complete